MAHCPNCEHEHATTRYDFGREKILRCKRCELMYIDPWPSEEEIRAVYGDNYFVNPGFLNGDNQSLFGYADYIAERFNKQIQYARIAREMLSRLGPLERRPKLLEVGCGLGYFLDQAFEEGFEVTGVEFNQFAVERLQHKYAFPVLSGGLETIAIKPISFDVAAMFDVIEHLRAPFAALDRLHRALVPGGLLVLSTMDAESWISRILGKRLEDFRRTREHLFFFSRKTMSRTLAEHGFEILAIRSIGHTFQLDFLFQRLELYNRRLFSSLRRIVNAVGMGSLQFHINPLTKMIVFARKSDVD
jgi:2-polyprenyl-3-methyl-5-hydroxy-6-metoxy-1,4-benzoquinol methylase